MGKTLFKHQNSNRHVTGAEFDVTDDWGRIPKRGQTQSVTHNKWTHDDERALRRVDCPAVTVEVPVRALKSQRNQMGYE